MTSHRCVRCWGPLVLLAAAGAGSRPASAETFEVTLDGISFWYNGVENMDVELAIQPGDTVRWLWIEGFHNVSSGFPEDGKGGDLFLSGPPTSVAGTTFEYTFNEPGVFGYHCHPHEAAGMIPFVTVLGSLPQPVSTSSGWGAAGMVLCVWIAESLTLRRHRTLRTSATASMDRRP